MMKLRFVRLFMLFIVICGLMAGCSDKKVEKSADTKKEQTEEKAIETSVPKTTQTPIPKVTASAKQNEESEDTVNKTSTKKIQKAKKKYREFAQKLNKKPKYKNNLYTKVLTLGENDVPVLLVSKGVFTDGSAYTTSARIYQFVNNKVAYIGTLSSSGTSYPICAYGKYLLAGSHHSSTRMSVTKGKAAVSQINGLFLGGKCSVDKWVLEKGKKKNKSSQEISQSEADRLDYYCDDAGNYRGEPIEFDKVK